MTLQEYMADITPDPEFEGFSNADDMILAVDFSGTATDPNQYLLAQTGVTEASGALTAQTQDRQYLRTGQVTNKTGTSRAFTVNGDRYNKDAFQDALLDHALKFGKGQKVIKPYAYFDQLTGIGETGKVSIVVEDDLSGAAGETASFSATLTSVGEPAVYNYAPATP